MASLMIIVPDRVSDYVNKGEVVKRYYNPGNLFDDVHLVITNDDDLIRRRCRRWPATHGFQSTIYPTPAPSSCQPWAGGRGSSGPWLKHALALAQNVRPNLIRCHGALLNTFTAAAIKRKYGTPYAVSLHINPDEDVRGRAGGLIKRAVTYAQQDIERVGLLNADLVMPVYKPIVPYLQRLRRHPLRSLLQQP